MLGIYEYFWRLIPANPILLRVVESGGKRRRDLFIRCGYLGLLIFIVIFSLFAYGSSAAGLTSLSNLSQTSAGLFRGLSYWQLAMVSLLAPIFTAGAITQEKDSQTYDILLATPLTNGQIVLGSLLSRVFFVVALLISGVPIFAITQVFGGVSIRSIILSFLIAAATACVTGALAMAIAVFKVGTRRTIFSFYLFLVSYLVGIYLLDQVDFFHPFIQSGDPSKRGSGWLTGIHPFLALRAVFNDKTYLPPSYGDLPDNWKTWPIGFYLSNPAGFYITMMFVLSFVLVTPSIVFLRQLAQSTGTIRTWVLQKLHISKGDRTRKPRGVWNNPIAWREAKTKASAARATFLRYTFMLIGVLGAIALVVMHETELTPKQYLGTNSYNPTAMTLTVFSGEGGPAVTYNVRGNRPGQNTGGTNVTYEIPKRDVTGERKTENVTRELADLNRGRLEVASLQTVTDPIPNLAQAGKRTYLGSITVRDTRRRLDLEDTRQWLLGAIILEFSVILLIVTNAAASTVTREKEDGTLDLLLSTPITSRYYIWGKLRGLVAFVLPLLAVPIFSVLLFVIVDVFRQVFGGAPEREWLVFPESILVLPGTLVIVVAFASILGMQMSLRCRTTVMAVMSSIGIVVGACFGLGFCGYQAISSRQMGGVGLAFGAFSPFTLIAVLVDPRRFAESAFESPDNWFENRVTLFVCGWIAVAAYAGIVWTMYKSMVKNFDMTIRKQSR